MKHTVGCLVVAILSGPLCAQDEDALKRALEGRSVVVRMDMPATSAGIDIYADQEQPIDYSKQASRIRDSGVAIREGDRAIVTKIKVKDDLIEFQLGGGGFTFWNSSSSVSVPSVPKSNREKELEREVKKETDTDRRRRLQRQLDDERNDREREEARNKLIAEGENERRREKDRERALQAGSRFNLRYEKQVPANVLNPANFMRAMSKYVDFPGSGVHAPERPEDLRLERAAPLTALRKGMTFDEARDVLGDPERMDQRREGSLAVMVAVFHRGGDRIEATFVEGVLVRQAIAGR